jgi:hypothetical protein
MADILFDGAQAGPDWEDLFDTEGAWRDDYPLDELGNPVGNGIPDYKELHGGHWAIFTADDVSLGTGLEETALTADGRVYNGTAAAAHDIGNAYVYWTRDSAENTVLYAAAERLGTGDSSLDFEFNQEHFRLGHGGYGTGVPWNVDGARSDGDVLVELSFVGGALSTLQASQWNGGAWVALSSVVGEGCDIAETLCAVSNGAAITGGPWNPQQIDAGRFVEIGINVGALVGAQPRYTTVRLRTPEDAAFGYFDTSEPANAAPPRPGTLAPVIAPDTPSEGPVQPRRDAPVGFPAGGF